LITSSARPSAANIPGAEQADRHEGQCQIIQPGGAEFIAGDTGGRECETAAATGQASPLKNDLLKHDAEAERRNGQIEILETKRRYCRERPDHRREERAEQKRQQVGQSRLLGEDCGGIGADPEQGGMTQADLPGIAGE